jgi:hypothetical protein
LTRFQVEPPETKVLENLYKRVIAEIAVGQSILKKNRELIHRSERAKINRKSAERAKHDFI